MSKFQLILTGVFGAFIVLGVMFFSLSSGGGNKTANLVIWGTIPQNTWASFIPNTETVRDKRFSLQYVEIKESDFDQEFVSALAEGRGPDLVLLSHEKILGNRSRIVAVPYESFSERQFKNDYIEAGEVFLKGDGVLAFPLFVDPMVMFWNRDILSAGNLLNPPSFWDEMYLFAPTFSFKDSASNVVKEAIALGEYSNILHAKDILSLLIMQAGGNIVQNSFDGFSESTLNAKYGQILVPANAALLFFTEFSNPTKPHYSWNRSLPDSLSEFSSGDLALYFGYASELRLIKEKNPNLNFDVRGMPQVRNSQRPITFAKVYALAIPRGGANVEAAFFAATSLTSKETSSVLESFTNLPPARRDLLSIKPTDPYREVFYNASVISKTWDDQLPDVTSKIWKDMIESVTSGRARVEEAVNRAHEELSKSLRELR